MTNNSKYLQYIDVLKGVIIFFVVVGHAFHFGFAYYRSPLLSVVRSIDMPIFVFLSGFLVAASPLRFDMVGYISFWRKKARQLFLPLITLPTLYALCYSIPASEMIWGMYHGGYWFTWVLFEMFVLWFVFQLCNRYANPHQDIGLEVLWATLTLCVVLYVDHPWRIYAPESYGLFSWGKMNYLYHHFLIGYFAGRYKDFRDALLRREVIATATILFFWLIYEEVTSRAVLEGIPASIAGLIMAFGIADRLGRADTKFNNVLAYLGHESRTIYFTHYFFLFSVPAVKPFLIEVSKGGGRTFGWEVLFAFTYASLVIVITLVVVRLIKSNDILSWLCYGKALPKKYKPQYPTLKYGSDTDLPNSPIEG